MEAPLVYLDSNATTRLDPEVRAAMLPWLGERFGNPASAHALGRAARAAVEQARAAVARLAGALSPAEIVFTSGGTESIHTALLGVLAARPERRRVLTSTAEHAATRACLEHAVAEPARGRELVLVPVDASGRLDADMACAAANERCALASLLLANNETGVLLGRDALERIGGACREHGVVLHLDAVQVLGKLRCDVAALPADLVSFSAHKLHGPQGVGALWVRPGTPLAPLFRGGPQEGGRRAGTPSVAGIVGFGRAAERAQAELPGMERVAGLRERLEAGLAASMPGLTVHGAAAERLPNTTSAAFPGQDGETLVLYLAELGVCASTGAACAAERRGPSPVLLAMGLSPEVVGATLRFSLSRESTAAEVDTALARIGEACAALAALAGSASQGTPIRQRGGPGSIR